MRRIEHGGDDGSLSCGMIFPFLEHCIIVIHVLFVIMSLSAEER